MNRQLAKLPRPDAPLVFVVQPDALKASRARHSVTVAQVVAMYLADQSRHFRGKNKIEAERPLRSFARFYGDRPVVLCTQRDFAPWLEANPGWKSSHTQRQSIYRVMACFLWAEETHLIEFCPFHLPRAARENRQRLPEFLRKDEIETLLTCAAEQISIEERGRKLGPVAAKVAAAKRDLIVVQLGLWAALRLGEIVRLNVQDVDLAGRRLLILDGKGGDGCVWINGKLLDALRAWIGDRKTGPLIPNDDGAYLPRVTVHWRIVRLGRLAKLPRHLHTHVLRHSAATRLLETGSNIREVQSVLRHRDVSTTMVYTHVDPQNVQAGLDRL
jgi:integrase